MIARKIKALMNKGPKIYFGQEAEDVAIRPYLSDIAKGFYLDLGAFDPFHLSNTARLWIDGWSGVNVDANKKSIDRFIKVRPHDLNLNYAMISDSSYSQGVRKVMLSLPESTRDGMSNVGTVSDEQILNFSSKKFSSAYEVEAVSLRELIQRHQLSGMIDYMNVDIEGNDLAVIRDIDFDLIRPRVVTVEDYSFLCIGDGSSEIYERMFDSGYFLMARTRLTSIFVDKEFAGNNIA